MVEKLTKLAQNAFILKGVGFLNILSHNSSVGKSKQIPLVKPSVIGPGEWGATALTLEMTYCFSSVFLGKLISTAHPLIFWPLYHCFLFPSLFPTFPCPSQSYFPNSSMYTCKPNCSYVYGRVCVCVLHWETHPSLQITKLTACLDRSCPPLITSSQILQVCTFFHRQALGDLLWIPHPSTLILE